MSQNKFPFNQIPGLFRRVLCNFNEKNNLDPLDFGNLADLTYIRTSKPKK